MAKATSTKAKPSKITFAGTTGGTSTGVVVGAAAIGLAAGLAANIVRKFIVQSPTLASGDWSAALATEHKLVLAVFDKIEATTDKQATKRAMLLGTLKHALAKHDVQEGNVIYAALRDDGYASDADHLTHDHGYIKQYLYDLEVMPKDSGSWLPKVREFRDLIERHVREEEDDLYPKLKADLTPDQNKKLTLAMNKEGLKIA